MRKVAEIEGRAVQVFKRCAALGIDAEFHRGLGFGSAVARVLPHNLDVLALEPGGVMGFLNNEGPVDPASQVGEVQGVDALALDHRRGGDSSAGHRLRRFHDPFAIVSFRALSLAVHINQSAL